MDPDPEWLQQESFTVKWPSIKLVELFHCQSCRLSDAPGEIARLSLPGHLGLTLNLWIYFKPQLTFAIFAMLWNSHDAKAQRSHLISAHALSEISGAVCTFDSERLGGYIRFVKMLLHLAANVPVKARNDILFWLAWSCAWTWLFLRVVRMLRNAFWFQLKNCSSVICIETGVV